MPRVVCTLPGASTNIDDIEFINENGIMVSVEISEFLLGKFSRLDGFKRYEEPEIDTAKKPGRSKKV
jgi:hypothetical protein